MQWKVGAGMSDILSIPNNIYTLLDGRLKMLSADGGYRAAIDPVLLAASILVLVLLGLLTRCRWQKP